MKTVILYYSRTGYTKKYVDWICNETGSIPMSITKVDKKILKDANTIVFGSSIMASNIRKMKSAKKLIHKYQPKRVAFFATGLTEETNLFEMDKIKITNFTDINLETSPFFYLRGGFDYNRLNKFEQSMIKMYTKMVESKEDASEEEKKIGRFFSNVQDYTDETMVKPLIYFIQS